MDPTNHDSVAYNDKLGGKETLENDVVESKNENNTPEKLNEEIESALKKIEVAMGQTTLMAFRVWVAHPEMFSELKDLREKFEENKQTMSRESTSNILRKIRELLNTYWNDREKSIMADLGDCLFRLQQARSERHKMKSVGDTIIAIDKNIWKDVENFISSLDMVKWADTPEWTDINKRRTFSPSFDA